MHIQQWSFHTFLQPHAFSFAAPQSEPQLHDAHPPLLYKEPLVPAYYKNGQMLQRNWIDCKIKGLEEIHCLKMKH